MLLRHKSLSWFLKCQSIPNKVKAVWHGQPLTLTAGQTKKGNTVSLVHKSYVWKEGVPTAVSGPSYQISFHLVTVRKALQNPIK